MSVIILARAAKILVGLLTAEVARRAAKLEKHGLDTEVLLRKQRRQYELARKDLEIKQANKAVDLYKAHAEAQAAANGIK